MHGDKEVVKLFELLDYLASSARGLFEEPREYGPLRCLDAMKRIIEAALELGLVENAELVGYLKELGERLGKGMLLVLYNVEEFKKFVVEVNVELSAKTLEVLEKHAETG